MGWGHCGADDQGREIGYAISATCDEPGCDAEIDRGLAYVCGGMHGGGDHGCGRYFCAAHLFHSKSEDGRSVGVCMECKPPPLPGGVINQTGCRPGGTIIGSYKTIPSSRRRKSK